VIYTKIIDFLAQNPWVLALCAIVTLWPLLKTLVRLLSKLDELTFQKVKIGDETFLTAKSNTSYFISIITLHIIYLTAAVFLRDIAHDVTNLIVKNETAIAQLAKALLGFIRINCSMMIGTIIAEIAVLSWRIKSSFENEKKK
jgi:ABC-type sugar transport system permease subunit